MLQCLTSAKIRPPGYPADLRNIRKKTKRRRLRDILLTRDEETGREELENLIYLGVHFMVVYVT